MKCRIITVAWGDYHIRQLVDVVLPALLAEGNLPVLSAVLECELVVCTTLKGVEVLRSAPILEAVSTYCPVSSRLIDEFVGDPTAYGMTLSWSLFRGMEDLGPQMVDTYFIFLNADFVLADGCLASLFPLIDKGYRALMAPSYCVVAEQVLPLPRDLTRREAAAIAIAHRHPTVRAKTLNQRFCCTHLQDQFYWVVDETTIIARQFPMALVCLRPTRQVTEMQALWDYGVLSQFCPEIVPYVIGDSDDWMMIELRSADTARSQIQSGAISRREIAMGMVSFVTGDTLPLGRWTLCLHSANLPQPETDTATLELDRQVRQILEYLPDRDYGCFNHLQWLYHAPSFDDNRRKYLHHGSS